jgi:hypothetical protein
VSPSAESKVSDSSQQLAAISRADNRDRTSTVTSEQIGQGVSRTEGSMTVIADSRFKPTIGGEHLSSRSTQNSTTHTESTHLPVAEEPIVEVSIGRVEVKLDSPASPAVPKAPVRPTGFAEFEALRRYAAGLWHLRTR